MIVPALLLGGFMIGFLAGRWWVALAPVAFRVWIATATDVDEAPLWFLGLGYGLVGVIGARRCLPSTPRSS
jgi:hypothetical protein